MVACGGDDPHLRLGQSSTSLRRGYLHPQQHRPITHREAARFQSFPDDFQFTGTKIEIAKQIGNAVPPLLAKAVAATVYEIVVAIKGKKKVGRQVHTGGKKPTYVESTL